jgi:hypothetical protein
MNSSTHGSGSLETPVLNEQTVLETIDWQVDREERNTFLKLLRLESGSRPAEWRLRIKRQSNIINELGKLGKLAVLSAGPLLLTYNGSINIPERYSHWRETLEESPMMKYMNSIERAQLLGAKSSNWGRLEKSIQDLGHCLCLALKDLNDHSVLVAFNQLKVSFVKKAFSTDQATDDVILYIKWLGKSCQHVFLRTPCPKNLGNFIPPCGDEGEILPFVGTLKYISDLILSETRRSQGLSYEEARQLSQLGNIPRGLPYPSRNQTKEDVKSTVEVFQTEFHPSKVALDKYKSGLDTIINDYGTALLPKTHVSLTTSGRYDASRSQGGGSVYLVVMTRKYTDRALTLEVIQDLTGKFDQFGDQLLDPITAEIAMKLLGYGEYSKPIAYTVNPTIGDILYVPPENLQALWEVTLKISRKRVPQNLAKLLNLTASTMMLEAGHYDQPLEMHHGVMTFKTRTNRFKLAEGFFLPVKADVSIESGLKTRLTTGGMTAFSHLSQLPANYMREYLSKDPFHRTGLQEPDKLWSVLKIYKRRFEQRLNQKDASP